MVHKYRAKPIVIDGIRFPSQKEGRRYSELKILQKAGEITDLTLQPKFPLFVNAKHICFYIADFTYKDKSGSRIVEDCKGVRTDVYKLKKKMFEASYATTIHET